MRTNDWTSWKLVVVCVGLIVVQTGCAGALSSQSTTPRFLTRAGQVDVSGGASIDMVQDARFGAGGAVALTDNLGVGGTVEGTALGTSESLSGSLEGLAFAELDPALFEARVGLTLGTSSVVTRSFCVGLFPGGCGGSATRLETDLYVSPYAQVGVGATLRFLRLMASVRGAFAFGDVRVDGSPSQNLAYFTVGPMLSLRTKTEPVFVQVDAGLDLRSSIDAPEVAVWDASLWASASLGVRFDVSGVR